MFKEYDFMCCNTKVGTFYVDEDCIGRKFKLKLIPKYLESPCLFMLRPLHTDYELDDDMVRFFMGGRVVPKNRMSLDAILKRLGLSEYDPYLIAKHNRFACVRDKLWVDFNGERFEDVHPSAEEHLKHAGKLITDDARC